MTTARVLDIEPMVTVKEFAAATGYSEWSINQFCRRGEIRSGRRRAGSRGVKRLIPESEITRFVRMEEIR
ncbi:helix-turn-helix domain-containing protein [Corynebacterium doosanense]|uniref:Helix-turn-helix domain-containing protein n=1 Tax=Corynebacterium doosanense CAU 212 = DSM 45436 TaxID=558173 RepID=A0A097IJ69_9CORY|nr:helix-turn-helix domain-containing protein [Corynebacterium doosanense]AIT62169.1 hypothetical protein CDOO_01835 [Corynebacterium doosanense CAU 212 = DSM 45436]